MRSLPSNSAKAVRVFFKDYFVKENKHYFVRSSSVLPFCDPTVAFVNAGMNQFKNVLLGEEKPHHCKVANYQKCIRVGGKHNDLSQVGQDGFHHTFFEMLGNWDFSNGRYFKKEACEMAWKFLTSPPCSLNPRRLYVTYFSGDQSLGLPPDLETKEIWLQLGVAADRIVGFGTESNFWELGSTGPCGACTEIHVDLSDSNMAAQLVNQGHPLLIELWNIVFIQYKRELDGKLTVMQHHYVDTGMGLERLVCVLQGKFSNFDTDLFTPLFTTISKMSGVRAYRGQFGAKDVDGVDLAYRIFADHMRMATVALADNVFPDTNQKLRRVLRMALQISKQMFGMKNGSSVAREVSSRVAESLDPAYPEVGMNLKQVHTIIDHELELLQAQRSSVGERWSALVAREPRLLSLTNVTPALINAYSSLGDQPQGITGEMAFRLYDTYGLDVATIHELAHALELELDSNGLNSRLGAVKEISHGRYGETVNKPLSKECLDKLQAAVLPTDDSHKFCQYNPPLSASPVALISSGKLIWLKGDAEIRIQSESEVGVVLDRSCFYYESGGQASDRGHLVVCDSSGNEEAVLNVRSLVKYHGYVIHYGILHSRGCAECLLDDSKAVTVVIDRDLRLGLMRSHTATHLLNSALRQVVPFTHQKSSRVTGDSLTFDFAVYRHPFNLEDVVNVEESIRAVIRENVPIARSTVNSDQLIRMKNVTLVPGEVYPQTNIHVIDITSSSGLVSREACCGTHVVRTGDVKEFCIVDVKAAGTGVKQIRALTGPVALEAISAGDRLCAHVSNIGQNIIALCTDKSKINKLQIESFNVEVKSAKQDLIRGTLPYVVRTKALEQLDQKSNDLKDVARIVLRDAVKSEMLSILSAEGHKFLVHYLHSSSEVDKVLLSKATNLCPGIPILLLAYSQGELKARCVVPKDQVCTLSAEQWMKGVLAVVGSDGAAPRGQDPRLVCNMKPVRLDKTKLENIVQRAVQAASEMAQAAFG